MSPSGCWRVGLQGGLGRAQGISGGWPSHRCQVLPPQAPADPLQGSTPRLHGTGTPVCPSPHLPAETAPCAGPQGHMAGKGGEWLQPSRPHQLHLYAWSGWALSCARSPPGSLAHQSQAGSVPVPTPLCEGSTLLLFIILLLYIINIINISILYINIYFYINIFI